VLVLPSLALRAGRTILLSRKPWPVLHLAATVSMKFTTPAAAVVAVVLWARVEEDLGAVAEAVHAVTSVVTSVVEAVDAASSGALEAASVALLAVAVASPLHRLLVMHPRN
jgi:hypothetical protein